MATDLTGGLGPLIVVREDRPTLHSYDDAGMFQKALGERWPDQMVEVIYQISYVPPLKRKESDWLDVDDPRESIQLGGSAGHNVDVAGNPDIRLPTMDDKQAVRAYYGAEVCRVVVRTDVIREPDGSGHGAARHLYGG